MMAYNDPYKMLANKLVLSCSDLQLSRFLHSAKHIRKRITEELKASEFNGDFLDCIMVRLVKTGKVRSLGRPLQATTKFFYDELDVPRLRKEIRYYCERYGKEIK